MKTKKQYFKEIKTILEKNSKYSEYVNFLTKELDGLKKKSDNARDAAREKGALTDNTTKYIINRFNTLALIGDDVLTAEDLAKETNTTPAQVSYRCNELSRKGILDKLSISREKRNLIAYRLKK